MVVDRLTGEREHRRVFVTDQTLLVLLGIFSVFLM